MSRYEVLQLFHLTLCLFGCRIVLLHSTKLFKDFHEFFHDFLFVSLCPIFAFFLIFLIRRCGAPLLLGLAGILIEFA